MLIQLFYFFPPALALLLKSGTHNVLGYTDPVILENGALGILWVFLSYSSHLISSPNYTISH